MNSYGRQAMRHWQQIDPRRFVAIPDKPQFFSDLGRQAEEEIQARAVALAGPRREGESPQERDQRMNMARFTAESEVLREMVLIPAPEETEEPVPESWSVVSRAIQESLREEDPADPD